MRVIPIASNVAEIFAVPDIAQVPHTQSWLTGVANLRGGLFAVVDLAGFLGLRQQTTRSDQSRLVALNPKLEINCALLVDRLAGLRNSDELSAVDATDVEPVPQFVGQRLRDRQGRLWQELNLQALAADEHFLGIVS